MRLVGFFSQVGQANWNGLVFPQVKSVRDIEVCVEQLNSPLMSLKLQSKKKKAGLFVMTGFQF